MDNTQTPTPEDRATALLEGDFAYITERVMADHNPNFEAECENLTSDLFDAGLYGLLVHDERAGILMNGPLWDAVDEYLRAAWENSPLRD